MFSAVLCLSVREGDTWVRWSMDQMVWEGVRSSSPYFVEGLRESDGPWSEGGQVQSEPSPLPSSRIRTGGCGRYCLVMLMEGCLVQNMF